MNRNIPQNQKRHLAPLKSLKSLIPFIQSNAETRTEPKVAHAIVIGGSVAGLLTARVLLDFATKVTVIERDELPDAPLFRHGAPQARHAHGLMGRGRQIMEELFPGFTADMRQHGAIDINMGSESAFYMGGKRNKAFDSAISAISCSRALIEYGLYSQLAQNPRVTFRQKCAVGGLLTNEGRERIMGVHVLNRGENNNKPELIQANLVVDASGRGSRLPRWLEKLGVEPPNEITVDAKAGYASRIYSRADFGSDWKMMYYIAQAPDQSRGGIILPIESNEEDGERWLVTLVGLNGDHPPTDEAGFMAFARTLPAPELVKTVTTAAPLGEPYGYQNASNRLREYDKLPHHLEGLFALGDSVYALNPVYGQGMTVAALGVKTLQSVLRRYQQRNQMGNLAGAAGRFQRQLSKVIAGPWQMATGQDLRWPVTAAEHQPSLADRLMQNYFSGVLKTMADDPVVAEAFFYVQNMLKSPATILSPRIAWRVWRHERGDSKPVAQFKQGPNFAQ